jgi:hypothetical protein
MSEYTWTTEQGGFACSLNDPPTTLTDQVRILIGDKGPNPVAYLSDGQIGLILSYHGDDLYAAAAECAEACAAVVFQLMQEVQQGSGRHGLRIKNFDLAKAYQGFMEMATMLRNKSTVGTLPSYGALAGKVTCPQTLPTGGKSWVW